MRTDAGHSRLGAIAAIVVLVMIFGVKAWNDRLDEIQHAEAITTAVVNAVNHQVSGSLRGIVGIEEMIARQVATANLDDEFSQRVLGNLLAYPEVRYVGIVTPHGILQPKTWPQIPIGIGGLDVRERSYFKRVLSLAPGETAVVFGDPVLGLATRERSIHMAYPVRAGDGKLLAIVLAAINVDIYSEMIGKMVLDRDGGIAISTRDGKIIARFPDHEILFAKDISSSALFGQLLPNAPAGVSRLVAKADGNDKVQAYRTVEGFPFVVTAGLSMRAILAHWWQDLQIEFLVLLVMSGVILALALSADRRKMALLKYQDNLEKIVEERTAHLAQAKQLSDAIGSKLQLMRWAVEQSPNMIVITNRKQRILMVNDAFIQQTGYQRNQVLGRRPGELLYSGKHHETDYDALKQCLKAGLPWRGRFINRRADGQEFISAANIWPIRNDQDEITNFLAIQEDITEQVRIAEELVKAKQDAEQATKAKGEFLANMSHEIRTPMNAIIGFTEMLLRDVSTPKHKDRLKKIHLSAGHLLQLINDILDMSKIDAKKMQLNPEPFRLSDVVDSVIGQVSLKADEQHDVLLICIDPALPSVVIGDALRLKQCLINFAGNAVKFTQGGAVKIVLRLERESEDGLLIRFSVEDTGIGIAPDVLARLFTAFEQADASTTRRFGGTGLGLTLTKQLAELMGGAVGVESAPGLGSTFWFTALLQRASADDHVYSVEGDGVDLLQRLSSMHGRARILLVDDMQLNREVIADMLTEGGGMVAMAEDGSQAVVMVQAQRFDLILMDMQMPVMDGPSASRKIRAIPGYASVPIIALTANAFAEDRQVCLDAGMNDFLTKPIQPNVLYATLLKWLGQTSQSPNGPPAMLETPQAMVLDEEPGSSAVIVFAGFPEIDPEKIAAFQKKPSRYIAYFKIFSTQFGDAVTRLRQTLADDDRDEARRIVHSLRGSSGQLGMSGLQAQAKTLEEMVQSGAALADMDALISALSTRLETVLAAIETLPDPAG